MIRVILSELRHTSRINRIVTLYWLIRAPVNCGCIIGGGWVINESEWILGTSHSIHQWAATGHSFAYLILLENVLGWSYDIKTFECANHACKCYRGTLMMLIQDYPSLLHMYVKGLVSAARTTVTMRSCCGCSPFLVYLPMYVSSLMFNYKCACYLNSPSFCGLIGWFSAQ